MSSGRQSLALADDPIVPLYEGNVEEDLDVVARNGLAARITGGLSFPSKLPCPSWGIPATRCKVGSVLAQQRGSTCSFCYALRGNYLFPNVEQKLEERYAGLFHKLWVPAMIFLVRWQCDRWFRWLDSGDVQDANHLQNLITICRHTQDIIHWLPTREYKLIRDFDGEIPDNLVIRLSAHHIDGAPPEWWPTTSTVSVANPPVLSESCIAPEQDNRCLDCRACWDQTVQNVDYRLH